MNVLEIIRQAAVSGAETQTPVQAPATPVQNEQQPTPARPPLFALILHNDNTTYPDFVTRVLNATCGLSAEEASAKMYQAHSQGRACVFVGTQDLAETRLNAAQQMVATAVPGEDFHRLLRSCELMFTVEPERDGD